MTGPLVDEQDFPRNDIDVYSVRDARSKINRLENDAKEIMIKIQTKLEEYHALNRSSNESK